jgi:predicted transcriptional regulator
MLYLLDLNDVHPTIAVLDAYLRTLATDIKAGQYGESAIVVSTQDASVRRYVEMVAAQENLPIYVSPSTTSFALIQAKPGARLTETERETLRSVMELGGVIDARALANALKLRHTTAVNRLNSLESKGLLFRRRRPGRRTDLYVDYRIASAQYSFDTLNSALDATPTNSAVTNSAPTSAFVIESNGKAKQLPPTS